MERASALSLERMIIMKMPLFEVYTSREAAELWGLSENTVTQWCNRDRFEAHEARKSGKVWLVTKGGMERLTQIKEELVMEKFWNTENLVMVRNIFAPVIGKAVVAKGEANLNEDLKIIKSALRDYKAQRMDDDGTRYDIDNVIATIDFENKTCHIEYAVIWIGGKTDAKEINFNIDWTETVNNEIGITEISVFEKES
jgi:hypothetical protein